MGKIIVVSAILIGGQEVSGEIALVVDRIVGLPNVVTRDLPPESEGKEPKKVCSTEIKYLSSTGEIVTYEVKEDLEDLGLFIQDIHTINGEEVEGESALILSNIVSHLSKNSEDSSITEFSYNFGVNNIQKIGIDTPLDSLVEEINDYHSKEELEPSDSMNKDDIEEIVKNHSSEAIEKVDKLLKEIKQNSVTTDAVAKMIKDALAALPKEKK